MCRTLEDGFRPPKRKPSRLSLSPIRDQDSPDTSGMVSPSSPSAMIQAHLHSPEPSSQSGQHHSADSILSHQGILLFSCCSQPIKNVVLSSVPFPTMTVPSARECQLRVHGACSPRACTSMQQVIRVGMHCLPACCGAVARSASEACSLVIPSVIGQCASEA